MATANSYIQDSTAVVSMSSEVDYSAKVGQLNFDEESKSELNSESQKSTYIPATQRPDGSWRKAIRVKDGYIPQDEMPLYESKGKQWAKSQPTLPIGLDPSYLLPTTLTGKSNRKIPGLSAMFNDSELSAKSTKKKKKKSKTPKADLTSEMVKLDISPKNSNEMTTNNSTIPQPIATDPAKRIRNLKKKLRVISSLEDRIKSGELANPEKDQLEKIARKEEIQAEIEELELEIESV